MFCLHEERDEVKGARRQEYERRIKREEGRTKMEEGGGLENYLPRDGNEGEEREEGEGDRSEDKEEEKEEDIKIGVIAAEEKPLEE